VEFRQTGGLDSQVVLFTPRQECYSAVLIL
jgi:hypothetical protein